MQSPAPLPFSHLPETRKDKGMRSWIRHRWIFLITFFVSYYGLLRAVHSAPTPVAFHPNSVA